MLPMLKIGSAMHQLEAQRIIMSVFASLAKNSSQTVQTTILSNMEGAVAKGGEAAQRAAPGQVSTYLAANSPDIMVLEWNLGNAGVKESSFSDDFFKRWPNTKFILVTQTDIPLQDLQPYQGLGNVDTRLIKALDVKTGAITNTVPLAEVLGTAFTTVKNRLTGKPSGDLDTP